MPCFGAVTNGEQWVGFLGKLRPDNVLLEDTSAVVFRSLDDIEKDFEHFFEAFGLEGARRRSLLRRLQPGVARGTVQAPHARRIVPPGAERPVDYQGTQQFYEDLRQAMEAAFRPIRADRDALAACFVESRESHDASSRLERIANELGEALQGAESKYPDAVQAEVDGMSVGDAGIQPGGGYLARLLGEKSAGKTVFLQRFFDVTLGSKRDKFVLLWFDVERASPFDATQASRSLLAQLSSQVFGEEGPSWEHIREIYRREWNQHLRLLGADGNDLSVRQAFLRERHEAQERDPREALRRFAEFTARNRGRLVCFVVDNLDHLKEPEIVLEWAVATHLSMFAMTTIAMEDSTLWRLRRSARDQVADHQPDQFWLHRPMVRDVLRNRCDYLNRVITEAPKGSARTVTSVGRRGQWRWSVVPENLVRAVSAVLLDNEETAQWIGQLCNYNLRDVLETCQQIVLSPQLRTDKLLSMQVVKKVSRHRVLRTLIAPKSEQFLALPTDRVSNIFGFWLGPDFAPLLPMRILALLRAREDGDRNRRQPFAGFVGVFELSELLEGGASVPRAVTLAGLKHLATAGLVEPFNPADQELRDSDARVKLTPRARLHLDWAVGEISYVRLMAEVDPIVMDKAYVELYRSWRQFIDALSPGNEVNASKLESELTSVYVSYLFELASSTSPLVQTDAIEPIIRFESELRSAWLPAQ